MLTIFNFLLDNKQTGSSDPINVARLSNAEIGHFVIGVITGIVISAAIALVIYSIYSAKKGN